MSDTLTHAAGDRTIWAKLVRDRVAFVESIAADSVMPKRMPLALRFMKPSFQEPARWP
ncbi:hypothetical protein N0A02_23700 [Paraburkholderia acidicola]|uniref:Uncharacterized protein n=1 Tax=Paraburkholderia acidicola TaxID=1912599 RepID=A0ABV1LUI6_9BURK